MKAPIVSSGGGFIRLKRPLGRGLQFVKACDPDISDLAGVITGVKSVLYTDFDESDLPYVKTLCRSLGLKYILPETKGRQGFHLTRSRRMLLIGKNLGELSLAAKVWNRNRVGSKWGELLGYPKCCVRAYRKWSVAMLDQMNPGDVDIIRSIYENTDFQTSSFSFLLNNVFNFFSRCSSKNQEHQKNLARIAAINRRRGVDICLLHVISWHPCSYRCQESLLKAREIFSFLESYVPEFSLKLKTCLAKPVIFFDKYEFAVLNGTVSDGMVKYKFILPPFSLLRSENLKKIAFGSGIAVDRKGAKIYSGSHSVHGQLLAELPPLILDFR